MTTDFVNMKIFADRAAKFHDRLLRGPVSDAAFLRGFTTILESAFDVGVLIIAVVSDAQGAELAEYKIDMPAVQAPVDTKNLSDRAARLLLRYSRTPACDLDTGAVDEITRKASDLIFAHWAARDERTFLPRLDDAGMPDRVLQSVHEMVRDAPFLAVVHADMDNFKTINDAHGEEKGNVVIREFADRMRGAFADLGLIVRTGGEEFSAFLAGDDPVHFFERSEAFRRRMETDPLPAIDRPNTCSIGLAIYAAGDLPAHLGSTDRVLRDARSAERRAKDEGRNRIRLPKPAVEGEAPSAPASTRQDLLFSALASRTALESNEAAVFTTPFARAIARLLALRIVAQAPPASEFVEFISDFASRLDVAPSSSSWSALRDLTPTLGDGWPLPVTPFMPTVVWGAVVARALLAATFRCGAPLTARSELFFRAALGAPTSASLCLDIHREEHEFVSVALGPIACDVPTFEPVRIGRPWYQSDVESGADVLHRAPVKRERDAPESSEVFSPCLLMPIGDAAISEAKGIGSVVAGVVEVDDRPVQGGGLPDFWQSNLGRVVRACLRNPNISTIIAIGDEEGASQTIARLKLSQLDWATALPDLQRRMSIGADHLGVFRNRDVRFELVPAGGDDLLEAVVKKTGADDIGDPRRSSAIDLDLEAARRRLAIPALTTSNALSLTDGLRCKSLADAYPEAIQLLRSGTEPPQQETSRRTFREFPCFKLVLTQPFKDEVPDYWQKEREAIEDYVTRNFTSADGLFGKRLGVAGDEKTRREYGVNAAVSAVMDRRPTRRITLPVATGDELDAPLGLSMIQVLPRERDGKWHLDFQWIWRTVEVLVGFPFSAIGSIRWSEEFFQSVQRGLDDAGHIDRLERGQLTYVALSFHMFLDVGDKEIARAIVQDATK